MKRHMRIAVVGIAGLLAACSAAPHPANGEKVKVRDAVVEMAMMELALDDFQADVGRYPTESEGLAALEVRPPGEDKWAGPYRKVKKDPWGRDFIYHFPATHNNGGVDLLSPGPDGKEGTSDDVGSWPEGK